MIDVALDVERFVLNSFEFITVKDLINVDYFPKHKCPINNLFLVAPLFTPCSKNISEKDKYRDVRIEDQFGYSVQVKGLRLNMSVDFPIWSNFIRLVIENENNEVKMDYVEFAKILGYNRKNFGDVLKKRISESIIRLCSQVIIIDNNEDSDGDTKIIHLLDSGTINKKTKIVSVIVNTEALRLYKTDRFKLIDLDFYNDLPNEVSKALFLYYENHALNVFPLQVKNISERLNLVSKNSKEINRQIKLGHDHLVNCKYLEHYEFKSRNGKKYIQVKKGA